MQNRRQFLRSSLVAGAALLAVPALIGRTRAATTLTVASLFGDDKPETKVWVKIGTLLDQKLPGAFRLNIVKNGALGGEKEVAEGIKLGSIQASLATTSILSGWAPEIQILDLPFLFRDRQHVRKVVEGEIGTALKKKLAAQGFVALDYINYGARELLAKQPITRPEQLKGVRMRVIQSKLHTKLWSSFGAIPIGIPITETYNALQTGVAGAMDLTKSAYAGFKLYEVVPDMTETNHIWASGVVYFSQMFWNGLTDEQKAVFQEAASEGARYFNQLMVEDETSSMKLATAHGCKIFQPQEKSEWERGARSVWSDFAPIVGGIDRIESIRSMT
ncbi:MAG: TRAP transporter substrate-binding protein [Rhizobiaceae bacterium]